jgi:hypothetical protein
MLVVRLVVLATVGLAGCLRGGLAPDSPSSGRDLAVLDGGVDEDLSAPDLPPLEMMVVEDLLTVAHLDLAANGADQSLALDAAPLHEDLGAAPPDMTGVPDFALVPDMRPLADLLSIDLTPLPDLSTPVDILLETGFQLTPPFTTFSETRGVDVTPVEHDLLLTSLSVHGLTCTVTPIGSVYDSSGARIATGAATVIGDVAILQVSLVLRLSLTYRLAFYCAKGDGSLFLGNDPPYMNSTGLLRIGGTFESPDDAYPQNYNTGTPRLELIVY